MELADITNEKPEKRRTLLSMRRDDMNVCFTRSCNTHLFSLEIPRKLYLFWNFDY